VHKTEQLRHTRESVSGSVVSCPSCSTASVVACHARDSESTGQPCFTSQRFADSVPCGNTQLFLPRFFPLDSVANYTWGMFVGRVRGDQAEFCRVSLSFFFSFYFFLRKTRSKTVETERMTPLRDVMHSLYARTEPQALSLSLSV